jgi:uncharacterized heparinase superfamily protein
MKNFARLIRTVRHLKPSQLAWRVRYRLLRPLEESRWYDVARRIHSMVKGVQVRDERISTPCDLATDDAAEQLLAELQSGRLTLLNSQRPFRGGGDWCMTGGRTDDRLWKYTLHYHGWLVRLARGYAATGDVALAEQVAVQLDDWLRHCRLGQAGFSHYAWNSYAIATRLDYWRQLLNVLPAEFWDARRQLHDDLLPNMAAHAAYLSRHVEWDLRANHLLRDALGLAAAARSFDGKEPRRWMSQAERIVAKQLDEQILPDGVHFERSAAYHLEVMNDLAKLAVLVNDQSIAARIREMWSRMAEAAAWLRHPDGRVVQFNDGARCEADETLGRGRAIGLDVVWRRKAGGRWLDSSGIVAWHGDPWTVFFDVGELGPALQPGHAHADTLTVEVSYAGQRVFVDPGCHGYDRDVRREYDRSTAGHNTVCIDHADSSEVWHIFRVGRRARPAETNVAIHDDALSATAAHTGYDHLPGAPRHRRRISVYDDGPLEIVDDITGNGDHHVEGGFLLDPQWTAGVRSDGWLLKRGNTALRLRLDASHRVDVDIRPAVVHPDYGVELPTQRLVWRYQGRLPLRVRLKIPSTKSQIPIQSEITMTESKITAPV